MRVTQGFAHFPGAVAPGEQVIVPLGVMMQDEPGDYLLEFDLVRELVRWFDCPFK